MYGCSREDGRLLAATKSQAMTPYQQNQPTNPPQISSYNPYIPEHHRQIPHVGSYERRRASSDGYQQPGETGNEGLRRSTTTFQRQRGQSDNFSTAATYGGNGSGGQGVRFQSPSSSGSVRSNTEYRDRNPFTSTGSPDNYSTAATYGGSSARSRYAPPMTVSKPVPAQAPIQARSFKKDAYCPRYVNGYASPRRLETRLICPRCLFWVSLTWVDAEAVIKDIPLEDSHTLNLDRQGRDQEGHMRVCLVKSSMILFS